MHIQITEMPKGKVIGSVKLAKDRHIMTVTRLLYGSRTRFVQKVIHQGSGGARVTAFLKSDDFPSRSGESMICRSSAPSNWPKTGIS